MTIRNRMARQGDDIDVDDDTQKRDTHPIRSFLVFLFFMAVAILIFGALAARTGGFREIVSVKNEEWLQTRMRIRESRIVLPYDLVLTDIAVPAKPEAGSKAGLLIREANVSWRPFRGVRVRLEGPVASLVETEPGVFLPPDLEKLAAISNAAGIVDWLGPMNRRASLEIREGVLSVLTSEGTEVRRLEGISLSVLPVVLPGHPATHFRLETGRMTTPAGRYEGLKQEWLGIDGTGVVEIAFQVDAGGAPWGRDYWKGIQP
jgi:hypothetical protein